VEPAIHELDNVDTMVGKALGMRHSERVIPSGVSNVAMPVVPVYGTQRIRNNLAFDSVTGAAGDMFGITPLAVPDDMVRAVIAAQISHNDTATTHSGQFGMQWNRAGGFLTTIALVPNRVLNAFEVSHLGPADRLYMPPGAVLYFQYLTMNGARMVTLQYAFVDIPIGATFPP